MSDNTGGPAFPDWPESAFPSTFQSMSPEPHQVHRWGMTLRDYFAAKAMQADMATYTEDLIYENSEWFEARANKWYEVADAMLKVRQE